MGFDEDTIDFWIRRSLLEFEDERDLVTFSQSADQLKHEETALQEFIEGLKAHVVMDLASGVGRWLPLLFENLKPKQIIAVEPVEKFSEIAKRRLTNELVRTVTFVNSSTQKLKFREYAHVELVFVSGLLHYLSNESLINLASNLAKHLQNCNDLILRETVSTESGFQLSNVYSNQLKDRYSSNYRNKLEIIEMFESKQFLLIKSQPIYSEHSPYRKFNNTNRVLFHFRREN